MMMMMVGQWFHCQRFSQSQIFDTPQTQFGRVQDLSLDFVQRVVQ